MRLAKMQRLRACISDNADLTTYGSTNSGKKMAPQLHTILQTFL
jgi:hypothetical protein